MPPLTLRLRMILLFCVVMGVFLAGTYEVVYSSFMREVRAGLDSRLLDAAQPIIAELVARPSEHSLSQLNLPGQMLELVGPGGTVLEHSRGFEEAAVAQPLPNGDQPSFRTLHTSSNNLRAAIIPIQILDRRHWLIIAEPTASIDQTQANFRERLFGLWTVSLLLTTLIAVWYVGRSLSPIVALNQHAALLTKAASTHKELDVRLPIVNPNDEVGVLTTNFNVLFSRLGAVLRQLRQFVSDAAHELRTPLSVVRGETQFLLSQTRTVEEYQRTLRTIDGELTVMVRMIEGLFTLSMADAGQLRLQNESLYLHEIIEEALGIAAASARRKAVRIERMQWAEIECSGDQALLRQVFLILLENAIKYCHSNTTIRVGMALAEDHPEVTVQDEGFGIAPEHLPHIFERFYRAAPDCNDETRSGGLGLSIAEAIMRAHGGEIRCQSELGIGSTFVVVFPGVPKDGQRANKIEMQLPEAAVSAELRD